MIIDIQEKELDFVRSILRRTAKKYRQLLIHREILSGKLQELKVSVRWLITEEEPHGFYRLEYDRDRIHHYIQLNIKPQDSEKSIAHCFAHELSHMLLHGSGDYVRHLTGETQIPYCLQESMADNLADFVVSHCRFSDDTCSYILNMMEDTYCREFAQLLAEGFGSPLADAKFLDDFAVTPIPSEETSAEQSEETEAGCMIDADFWNAYFAQPEGTCPVDFWVHNYFWYLSILGRFYEIPEIFDEYMGEGSFAQVRDDMDFYHTSIRNGTAASNVARMLSEETIDDAPEHAKQRAFDLIDQFVQLRAREREENEA